MTIDKTTGVKGRQPTFFDKLPRFERVALVSLAGLVSAGLLVAVVFPPAGVTTAPRAGYDLESVLRLEPVPTVTVSVAPLTAPAAFDGLTVDEVARTLSYDLGMIAEGEADVPRLFLTSMPRDIADVPEVSFKKSVFFKSVLPLVLQVNEQILEDRARLKRIAENAGAGKAIAAEDRLWVAMMSKRYRTERGDYDALLQRVDIIPPSLALAQAAKESGWGSSRFAQVGNALFGQWTWDEDQGIEPRDRPEGSDHLVRGFDSLLKSVEAYMLNLNRHNAYRELRSLRAGMRERGDEISGVKLAGGLKSYSELGMEYVDRIRSMISYNELMALDNAALSGNDA